MALCEQVHYSLRWACLRRECWFHVVFLIFVYVGYSTQSWFLVEHGLNTMISDVQ